LYCFIPQLIDAIYPITDTGIQQWLSAKNGYALQSNMLGPLLVLFSIITPALPSTKIVIVESITVVAR
jgi:hypothetical protein